MSSDRTIESTPLKPTKPRRAWDQIAADPKPRWYHYAVRRLPVSLFVSFLTLFFVVPLLLLAITALYRWIL